MAPRLFNAGGKCDLCKLKIFGACLEHEFGGCEKHYQEHVAKCSAHGAGATSRLPRLTDPRDFDRALAGVAAASQEQGRGDNELMQRLLEVLQRELGPAAAADIREIRQDWQESRARVARLVEGTEPPP